MPPRDPKLRPALERALPADDVPGSTRVLPWPERWLVVFGDGERHLVWVRARRTDRLGRETVDLEWYAAGSTWTESYLAAPAKMRRL